jgi:hypothetical protein
VETAVFRGLDDARRRLGLFIDHYNFQRPHSGIGGLVPADRFFAAAPQVLSTLKERVAKNSAELARDGLPRKPFYLTGRIGDQSISLHAEGEKVVLTNGDGPREEVDSVRRGHGRTCPSRSARRCPSRSRQWATLPTTQPPLTAATLRRAPTAAARRRALPVAYRTAQRSLGVAMARPPEKANNPTRRQAPALTAQEGARAGGGGGAAAN